MDVKGLYQKVKALVKEKNIKFIIPHQVQMPHRVWRPETVPKTGVIIVDYVTMLPPEGEKNAEV